MFYFCICVLSLLALIGIIQICRGIVQVITNSRDDKEIILIEPVFDHQEDAEYKLRSAAKKVMWMGRFAPDRVLCLDCNLDNETRKLCRLVCNDYPFMSLCSKEEVFDKIETMINS
ncbi:MAG: hypothetical protein VZR54_09025 [Ruminococcus sp.]|jgi:hypothetical protein|nr:hypothetical protein [Ruminococcus sp.]